MVGCGLASILPYTVCEEIIADGLRTYHRTTARSLAAGHTDMDLESPARPFDPVLGDVESILTLLSGRSELETPPDLRIMTTCDTRPAEHATISRLIHGVLVLYTTSFPTEREFHWQT